MIVVGVYLKVDNCTREICIHLIECLLILLKLIESLPRNDLNFATIQTDKLMEQFKAQAARNGAAFCRMAFLQSPTNGIDGRYL
jgi:hypothetical protein